MTGGLCAGGTRLFEFGTGRDGVGGGSVTPEVLFAIGELVTPVCVRVSGVALLTDCGSERCRVGASFGNRIALPRSMTMS